MVQGFQILFWLLIAAGLGVALLSALEKRVRWIDSLCAFFGEGCRRTADFTLFTLPVSWWGGLFYLALALTALAAPSLTGWLVMAGAGFELTFIWIMLAMRAFCIFCLLNAGVVAGLLFLFLDTGRTWRSLIIVLLFLLVSSVLLWRENRDRIRGIPMLKQRAPSEKEITLVDRPALGPKNAPVTVMEFSDYLCPACCKAHEVTKRVYSMYEGQVRWIFKDLPLPMHPGARELAAAAHCAETQGKFWEFQDYLFRRSSCPDRDELIKAAADLGLDVAGFSNCLQRNPFLDQVDKDVREAHKAGITSTPTFLINGEMYRGAAGLKEFSKRIKKALQAKDKVPAP